MDARHRRLAAAELQARPITAARHRRLAVANSATTARRCGRLKKKAFLAAAVALPAALVTISAIRSSSTVNAARKSSKTGKMAAASVVISAIRSNSAVNAARKSAKTGKMAAASVVISAIRSSSTVNGDGEPAGCKQRGRTRALSASSRRLPQATGMTAARRRCVFLARQRASPLASYRSYHICQAALPTIRLEAWPGNGEFVFQGDGVHTAVREISVRAAIPSSHIRTGPNRDSCRQSVCRHPNPALSIC